jgi:hypothetical protein
LGQLSRLGYGAGGLSGWKKIPQFWPDIQINCYNQKSPIFKQPIILSIISKKVDERPWHFILPSITIKFFHPRDLDFFSVRKISCHMVNFLIPAEIHNAGQEGEKILWQYWGKSGTLYKSWDDWLIVSDHSFWSYYMNFFLQFHNDLYNIRETGTIIKFKAIFIKRINPLVLALLGFLYNSESLKSFCLPSNFLLEKLIIKLHAFLFLKKIN